jgi:hypothetical protein
MLGIDACGIEIEGELMDAAQQFADDFGLPVEFIRGSFIPKGGDPLSLPPGRCDLVPRSLETARQEERAPQAVEAALEKAPDLQQQGRWPDARATPSVARSRQLVG